MGEKTHIQWTGATINFWGGCTEVGPGCDNCYAEAWDKSLGGAHFGTGQPRRWIKGAVATLEKLNRTRPGTWVFIQSMSDLFDNEVPLAWFETAWKAICTATNLRIQIVTKRLPMVEKRLAQIGATGWPQHAGLIATICNQDEADRDVPRLLKLKAERCIHWVGLSMEPLLGPVDLTEIAVARPDLRASIIIDALSGTGGFKGPHGRLDWVIVGGESGPQARPMHPDLARSLRDQCNAAGVPFFFKQWGEWAPGERSDEIDARITMPGQNINLWAWPDGKSKDSWKHGPVSVRVGKATAGRLLDGRTWDQMPGVADA